MLRAEPAETRFVRVTGATECALLNILTERPSACATGLDPLQHHSNDTVTVREMEGGDAARWDDFVLRSPDATFFHRAGWKRVVDHSWTS